MPTSSICGSLSEKVTGGLPVTVVLVYQDTSLVISLMTAFWLFSVATLGLDSMFRFPTCFMASSRAFTLLFAMLIWNTLVGTDGARPWDTVSGLRSAPT